MTHTEIYRGKIEHYSNGGEDHLISLTGLDYPLAEVIQDDIDEHGNYLTVRYYISRVERKPEELAEEYSKTVCGLGEAEYCMAHSETTGYLWTDENLMVGGHDLLKELRSHVGSWLHLQIDYSREASAIG